MLTLLIETSTEKGAVFLFEKDQLLFEGFLPPGLHNSTDLLPTLDGGLKSLGITTAEIALIGVGIGPGSYTGLRVGAMAAKTISYVHAIPLVGLCTLCCFSSQQKDPFAVIIDAKIGGAYLHVDNKAPLVSSLVDLPIHLGKVRRLITPNKQVLSVKLSQLYPSLQLEWEEARPCPKTMLRATLEKVKQKEYTTDGSVELLYMRKTQAEIERQF